MNLKHRTASLILSLTLAAFILTGCSTASDYVRSGTFFTATGATIPEEDLINLYTFEQTEETTEQDAPEPIAALAAEEEETEIAKAAEPPTTTAATAPVNTTTAAAPVNTATTAPPVTTTTTAATTIVTTAASTSALPTPAAPSYDPPAAVSGINNETFLAYNTLCERYKPTTGQTCYLFNFNRYLSAGFGVNGTVLPTEADYGIKGAVNGRLIDFTVYDHTHTKALRNIYLQALDASVDNEAVYIKTAATFTIDTSAFTNGLYRVVGSFSDERQLALYFYINGNDTWLCEQKSVVTYIEKSYETRRAELMAVLKAGNVTPENSLSLEKLYYPFKSTAGTVRCDTQLWIDLSDTFINDSWSDEYKLYVIQAWMRENIAYDNFVSESLSHSRAQHFMDLTGAQSAYNLRAGVCFDYVNIIAIMCRAHGIPAVTIGSESMNHVWNVVYVNGRWMEYDACLSDQYCVGEDTTVRTRTGEPLYDGIYSPLLVNNGTGRMPDDALANQYLQWDTNYLY